MSNIKTDIWMPFYIDKYLGDTMHLTTEMHGAYLLLLMAGWKNGGYIDCSDISLAATARVTLKAWKTMRPIIAKYFQEKDGLWSQGRQLDEIVKANGRAEVARQNGKRGGRPSHTPKQTPEKPSGIPDGVPNGVPATKPPVEAKPNPEKSSLSLQVKSMSTYSCESDGNPPSADAPTLFDAEAYPETIPESDPAPRKANPHWDAMVAGLGWEPGKITKTTMGLIGKAVKELKEIGATPEDIKARCENYRAKWPGMDITPPAILKHWSTLASGAPAPPPSRSDPGFEDKTPTIIPGDPASMALLEKMARGEA